MKNKHIFIPLIVFVSVCFVCLIVSIISFKAFDKNMSYSARTVEFLYDGASDGKDPDGNEFNAADLLTEEVVTKSISDAGLNYKYEDVKPYLLMNNVVSDNVISEITAFTSLVKSGNATTTINSSNYHATKYNVILYRDFDNKISSNDLNKLVDKIVDNYCDSFNTAYQKSFDSTNYSNIYSIDTYDYIYQVEVYENKLKALAKYSSNLFNEKNSFTYKGKTFNDIALKANSLVSNEISKIRNSIIFNALSKDVDRLKDYYNYKIKNLEVDQSKYEKDLTNVEAQITAYNKGQTVYVGAGETVVKVDSNSEATYNSLLSKKISISETISTIKTNIKDYQQILADIDAATATPTEYEKVEANIASLGEEYTSLEKTYNEMLDSYNDKYISNGSISTSAVEYHNTNSLFSTAFIVKAIKITFPFAAISLVGICVFYFIRALKKNKKEELVTA